MNRRQVGLLLVREIRQGTASAGWTWEQSAFADADADPPILVHHFGRR
jgi:hypothetical protein